MTDNHDDCGCLPPCRRDPEKEYDPNLPVNPDPNHCTLCTGDKTDNIFYQPGAPGSHGRCILDELTYEQVYLVLERTPKAKKDLLRITDDPILIAMANDSRVVEDPIDEDERMRKRLHRNSLPLYSSVLNGNFDGTPNGVPCKRK